MNFFLLLFITVFTIIFIQFNEKITTMIFFRHSQLEFFYIFLHIFNIIYLFHCEKKLFNKKILQINVCYQFERFPWNIKLFKQWKKRTKSKKIYVNGFEEVAEIWKSHLENSFVIQTVGTVSICETRKKSTEKTTNNEVIKTYSVAKKNVKIFYLLAKYVPSTHLLPETLQKLPIFFRYKPV